MVVYVIKTIKKIYVAQGFPLNKTLKYSRNKHRSSSHNKFLKSLNSKHFKGKKRDNAHNLTTLKTCIPI